MEWKKRFIIGHLHNTEVLCFPLSSRTCQYQELIKAGSSPGSNLSTVKVLNVLCHLLPSADLPSTWIYWNEIQEVKWRLCVWHTRNRWRSSFISKHCSNRSIEEIIYCPVLRNTVSCFPSIGLTAIKHLTKISSGQCFGD